MNLDKKIDEILVDSVGMDFCENDECTLYKQYLDTKKAIKQLIKEQVTESYKKGYIDKGLEEITK